MKKLEKPSKVFNVDRSENRAGIITHYSILQVKMNRQEKLQTFFITNLRRDQVLLGWPWFAHFNLIINWTVRTIQGEVELKIRWLKWRRRVETLTPRTMLKDIGQALQNRMMQ